MTSSTWKLKRDALYRGDSASEVSLPSPSADNSLVRHILYLEGYGRETPYLSASESREIAGEFAKPNGNIYIGKPDEWSKSAVKHRSRTELLQLLKGKGKGDAEWSSAFEVMQAHRYVEEKQEHLADFTELKNLSEEQLRDITNKTFTK